LKWDFNREATHRDFTWDFDSEATQRVFTWDFDREFHTSLKKRRHEGRLLKCHGSYEPKKKLATAFHFYACMLSVLTPMTYSDFPLNNNC